MKNRIILLLTLCLSFICVDAEELKSGSSVEKEMYAEKVKNAFRKAWNAYKEYVSSYPFDFVIGSVHVVNRMDPYYGEFFEDKTDAEAYRQAFLETLTDIRAIKDFDVLGHIDYIVRYGKEKEKYYSYTKFSDEIDEILKYLIAHGKGIELNTAGFKYGLGFCHPHPDILKRYCELGGEIITIGADGHKPEHIAYDFEKVAPILRECGFKYYTEFKERKPVFKQLP